MFIPILKNVVIFYMCFYSYNKICKISKHTFNYFFIQAFFSLLLGLEACIFKLSIPELSYFLPAVSLFVCVSISEKNFSHTNFCISLTSYVLNLLIFQLIALIVASIFIIAFHSSAFTNVNLPIFIASMLHPFAIIGMFKLKRLSGRISLFSFNSMINWNTILGVIVLAIFTFEQIAALGHSIIRYIRVLIPIDRNEMGSYENFPQNFYSIGAIHLVLEKELLEFW